MWLTYRTFKISTTEVQLPTAIEIWNNDLYFAKNGIALNLLVEFRDRIVLTLRCGEDYKKSSALTVHRTAAFIIYNGRCLEQPEKKKKKTLPRAEQSMEKGLGLSGD